MNFNIFCKGLFSFALVLTLVSIEQPSINAQKGKAIQLRSKKGTCLDANTGKSGKVPYMRTCDNGTNLNLLWAPVKADSDSFFIKAYATGGLCLDANAGVVGRNVYLNSCNSSNSSHKWYNARFSSRPFTEVQLRTEARNGSCLDANTGEQGKPAYIRNCDNGQNNSLIWSWRDLGD